MLVAQRKRELLEEAERLAAKLERGQASRSEVRPVLNALFLPSGSPASRFAHVEKLAGTLPRSWLAKRSKRAPDQYRAVAGMLGEVRAGNFNDEELGFLLGWMVRLLHVRDHEQRKKARQKGHEDEN